MIMKLNKTFALFYKCNLVIRGINFHNNFSWSLYCLLFKTIMIIIDRQHVMIKSIQVPNKSLGIDHLENDIII